MSKFDGLRTRPLPQKSKFEGLRIKPAAKEPAGDTWGEFIPKALASGVASIADIPQGILSLLENNEGPSYLSPTERGLFELENPGSTTPANFFGSLPLASSKIKEGVKALTGWDMHTNPSNTAQKIVGHGIDFALPNALLPGSGLAATGAKAAALANAPKANLLSRFANKSKEIAKKLTPEPVRTGAAIGATSGLLQEEGVSPLVADIGTAIALPVATAGGKNLFNKFSKENRIANAEARVANAYRQQIGEENVPAVLEKIKAYQKQNNPLGLQLTTPEVAQDAGLSKFSRTQSNFPLLSQRHQANNTKLLNSLKGIGETGLLESVKGESIRQPFVQRFDKAVEKRFKDTKPLFDQLEMIQEGVDPSIPRALLEREIAVSSPGNRPFLERYYKGLNRNEVDPELVKRANSLRNSLSSIENDYLKNQYGAVKSPVIDNLKASYNQDLSQIEPFLNPRPAQLERTIQELGDKVNAFNLSGESNAARQALQIKKAYEEALAQNPIGLQHRNIYRERSKDINELERSPLLNNFIKKNKDVSKLEGFTVPSEKIPDLILSADLPNTKILIDKSKGNKELLNLVKGTYIDKLIETSTLTNGNFSYDKAKKFIDNKFMKEKLDVVFNSQEREKIDKFLDVLKRRNYVDTAGKAVGSDTQQKLKIEAEFKDSLSSLRKFITKKAFKSSTLNNLGETALDLWDTATNYRYNNLLEDTLANPESFARIMQNPTPIKTFRDFYNPLPSLIGVINARRE